MITIPGSVIKGCTSMSSILYNLWKINQLLFYILLHIMKALKHVSNIRPLQTFMLVTVIIYPNKYIMCGDYFNSLFSFS
jgi:hypothetical protein